MAPLKYVVIGASAASIAFMNKIARLDSLAQITCISQEKELPYNKCFLADYCAGSKQEQEVLLNTTYLTNRVTWLLDTRVIRLDVQNKAVITATDSQIAYDTLFLGMGSSPFIPNCVTDTSTIYTFHTLQDTNNLLAAVRTQKIKNAIIIGAGLSGIECADALHKNGVKVTIIEQKEFILPSILDQESALFLQNHIAAQGITILTNQLIESVEQNGQAISIKKEVRLEADLIVLTTGLRPNSALAKEAGIAIDDNGGVIVDHNLQTSVKGVYAGGDLIAITNTLTGHANLSCTWPDAMMQGMCAAQAAFGCNGQPYKGAPIIVNSAFFGLNFAQAGYKQPRLGQVNRRKEGAGFYQSYILENDQLKGFLVLGNTHDYAQLRRLILTGTKATF
jgi:NAD(P)H-nitrite reductase large subunit